MIKIRINGERYECPSCWQEITVKQYIRILLEWDQDKDIADRDYLKLFSILTNDRFRFKENTVENDITIIDAVGWVLTQAFDFDKQMPKVLQLRGVIYDIPQDPRELSIGQNIHLRRVIDKSKILEENIAIATAIYLQPIVDNSLFKMDKAELLAKEVEQMPINLIYPIGFFLLKRHMGFGAMPTGIWQLTLISLKQNLKRLFPNWRKSKGYTRSTI